MLQPSSYYVSRSSPELSTGPENVIGRGFCVVPLADTPEMLAPRHDITQLTFRNSHEDNLLLNKQNRHQLGSGSH